MKPSTRDLFHVICAVALTSGVAACDAPEEDRIGPEDFRQGGSMDEAARQRGATTAPGHGGGLEPRGDYRLGTDLLPEGELGTPMGEMGTGQSSTAEQPVAMPGETLERGDDEAGPERGSDPERGGAIGEPGAGGRGSVP